MSVAPSDDLWINERRLN